MISRRTFLRATGALSASGLLAGLYTWQVEPFWLEFVKHDLSITGLPQTLKGKTLLQISDIHVGNRFDYQFIIDSFKKASVLKPDIVVYTAGAFDLEDGRQLYINRALGHSHQVRFNVRPEITVFTLA